MCEGMSIIVGVRADIYVMHIHIGKQGMQGNIQKYLRHKNPKMSLAFWKYLFKK